MLNRLSDRTSKDAVSCHAVNVIHTKRLCLNSLVIHLVYDWVPREASRIDGTRLMTVGACGRKGSR